MGQKVNLLTLRATNNNFFLANNNWLFLYSFIKVMDYFFWKKKIFLTNISFFLSNNKFYFTFFIFFRDFKINFFLKKKYKKKKKKKLNFSSISLLFNSFKILKKNLFVFKIITLNTFLKKEKEIITKFFSFFKKFALIIFPRRFSFFLDFLQLTILFLKKKITIQFFIKIFVEVFRILQKKRHSKFLNFFTDYINVLLSDFSSFNYISGIKVTISGKLKGKLRSSTFNNIFGSVPIQTLKCNIDFAKSHAFTVYGVFGIKVWVSYYK